MAKWTVIAELRDPMGSLGIIFTAEARTTKGALELVEYAQAHLSAPKGMTLVYWVWDRVERRFTPGALRAMARGNASRAREL